MAQRQRYHSSFILDASMDALPELAQKSQEVLFDNFAGTHVYMLLAQFDEEED